MTSAPARAAAAARAGIPACESRSQGAVEPAVRQRLEAIGVAEVIGLLERGVERGDVEPSDGARQLRRT